MTHRAFSAHLHRQYDSWDSAEQTPNGEDATDNCYDKRQNQVVVWFVDEVRRVPGTRSLHGRLSIHVQRYLNGLGMHGTCTRY